MKKLLLMLSTALMLTFTGCMQFDDTRIWDAIDELEDLYDNLDGRLEKLEEECEKMNTNIEALQTLVSALQAQDTITTIAPIKQGDKIIGYTISFSKSEPITIYHGEDGKDGADGEDGKDGANGSDGYTPTIGVAKDADENYYWTLDGEWLLDAEGNKIKANGNEGKDGADGEDGEDGIIPKLEIRDGYWYISYDNGQSWVELGKATGEDGKDGANGADGADGEDGKDGENGKDGADGDSLFESVTWDEEYAYFTLSDGTVITIPLSTGSNAGGTFATTPPNNEIWYVSTNKSIVEPNAADVFGATIISNTYENGKGVIVFDSAVTSIGGFAFAWCDNIASIAIPDSVTPIGLCAFQNCSNLASITLGNSVTIIGSQAFWNCSSLTSITIPDGVTSIGYEAFAGCESLTSITIPESVTSIGDGAFTNCYTLPRITIPESVTEVGYEIFWNCEELTEVYCKPTTPPAAVIMLDYSPPATSWILFNSGSNCKVYVPIESVDAYMDADGWSDYAGYIVGYDFENDGSGEDTTTPPANEIWYTSTDGEVVTPYSAYAFGLNILSNTYKNGVGIITFDGDVTSIGEWAFYECLSLTSITIPDSVTSIEQRAFYNCSSLTSITIPDSVTSIGYAAFGDCSSLTSIVIPDSVTSIGDQAFYECLCLANVTIGSGVTSIGHIAFRGCSSLTSITIPDSVTSIGAQAFSDCTSLASVTIGNGVTSIGNYAFWNCSSLTSITIPDGVTSIGDYAFQLCSSLTSVTIGNGVTEIGEFAFNGCTSLTSITIPDSVTSIGNWAFFYCTSLTSITIPDSVTSIGDGAISGCTSLTSIYGKYASNDGRCLIIDGVLNSFAPAGLTEYTIPDSVTSIGNVAFRNCTSLTSVTIPDSVTSIGEAAFLACGQLESVTIGSGVTSIGTQAFSYCESLTSFYGKYASEDGRCLIVDGTLNSFAPAGLTEYTIPDSVTSIGEAAFFGCWQLESVTIGSGVTSIGYSAFAVCDNLAFVHCKSTTPPTMLHSSNDTPTFTSYLLNIYVPEGCVDAYKSADGWSDYADAIRTYAPNNYANWLGTYTLSGKGNAYDSESDSLVERDVEFTISVEAKDESTMSYYVTGWDGCSYPIEAQYNSENELILSAGVIAEGVDLGDSGVGNLYFAGYIGDGYIRVVGPIIKLSKDSNQAVGLTVGGNEVTGATICLYQDGSFYLLRSYGDVYTPLDMEVGGSASYAPMKVGARGGRYFEVDRTRKLNVIK